MAASAASGWRRAAWWGVLACVLLVHLRLTLLVADSWIGPGDAAPPPPPIQVAFVQTLASAEPPAFRPPPPRARLRTPPAPRPAASAASAPEAVPELLASDAVAAAPDPVSEVLQVPERASAVPPQDAASAPIETGRVAVIPTEAPVSAVIDASFDWPLSTRLSYVLTGQYRGPLHGSATVDWLRQGPRYQVRLTVRVPPFFERRMVSDGQLGPDGLAPLRYDQETEVLLQDLRRETVLFEPTQIRLANGRTAPAQAGVQDTASQFVQMTWLFLSRPDSLRVGQQVEFPLALPRRVGRWVYEVSEAATLELPFGRIDTVHIQPRPENQRPNELSVEIWIAPSLQYLPVRIGIRQDAETYLQLELASQPLQAAAPGAAASAAK